MNHRRVTNLRDLVCMSFHTILAINNLKIVLSGCFSVVGKGKTASVMSNGIMENLSSLWPLYFLKKIEETLLES